MAVEPRNRFSKHDQIREKVEKCAAEPPLDRRATFLRQRGAAQLTSFLSEHMSLYTMGVESFLLSFYQATDLSGFSM